MYLSGFLYINSEMSASHFNYTDKNCMKEIALHNSFVKHRQKKGGKNDERKPQIPVIKQKLRCFPLIFLLVTHDFGKYLSLSNFIF